MAFSIKPTNYVSDRVQSVAHSFRSQSNISTQDSNPDPNSDSGPGAFLHFQEKKKKNQNEHSKKELLNYNSEVVYFSLADDALEELHTILTRISELAASSWGRSLRPLVRDQFDSEVESLRKEYNRTIERTDFNRENLFFACPHARNGAPDSNAGHLLGKDYRPEVPRLAQMRLGTFDGASETYATATLYIEKIYHLHNRICEAMAQLHGSFSILSNNYIDEVSQDFSLAGKMSVIQDLVDNGDLALQAQCNVTPFAVQSLLHY